MGSSEGVEEERVGRGLLLSRGGDWGPEGERLSVGRRTQGAGLKGKSPGLSARAVAADASDKAVPHWTLGHTLQEEKEITVFP